MCAGYYINLCSILYSQSFNTGEGQKCIGNVWLVTGYDHDVQIKVKIGAHSLAT